MTQFATLGANALRATPLAEPRLAAPMLDDLAIFERLPITPAEPFVAPRLRLVLEEDRPVHRSLRLTRRGRMVCLVALILPVAAVVASLMVGLARSHASTTPAGPAAGGSGLASSQGHPSVVVQPGDTLWSIAGEVAPNTDPRVTVQRIIDRNALSGASIEAGQILVMPN